MEVSIDNIKVEVLPAKECVRSISDKQSRSNSKKQLK